MRAYAAFAPTFWTGDTGRAIKARGRDAVVMAAYLISGPSATMYGLYYLPLPTLCHEAGFTPEEARTTLADLEQLRFAFYDPAAELVWVPTMPRWQIAPELHAADKRVRGIERYLRPFLGHPFGRDFVRRYRRAYSLSISISTKGLRGALQAPPKPGTGTGTETGTGENNDPPTPPAGAGGSRSGSGRVGGAGTGNGTALKGPALDGAITGLVTFWRRLGRFDRNAADGWAQEPLTVPQDANVRAWRRALRTGRLTVDELRTGIANRVFNELLQMGRVTGDEAWPPPGGDQPPNEGRA